ncbi:MAG TPA: RcpC/CpaB family pilus assembly protein [Arthrobacter sp.]
MKTRLIGAAAALLLAVTGTVAVTSYVQGADQRAMHGAEVRNIYVIDKEVPANTPAAELTKFTKTASVPVSAIAPGAVTDMSTLDGKVTSAKLLQGEQLLNARLVDPASLLIPGKVAVPAGLQEVTVQLGPDRVAGGQLIAGDTVGIFVSFTDGAGPGSPTTHLAFQKVLVTSVQGAPAEPTGKAAATTAPGPPVPTGAMLITLARPAHEAEKIVFAAEYGTLWLSKEPAAANGDGTSVVTKDGYYK